MCMHAPSEARLEEVSDPLLLEFRMVVSLLTWKLGTRLTWVLGTELESAGKTGDALRR